MKDWAEKLNCAITVCDAEGKVIYMNDKSVETNGNVLGKNIMGCHNERSRSIIDRLLSESSSNAYTITKKGQKKLIYQTPWYDEDGRTAGLVEFSIVIPDGMPHYDRDKTSMQ